MNVASLLPVPVVFVFGSNLAGYHGAGSAAEAHRHYGAKWGVGVGRTGRAYAIPTKTEKFQTMDLQSIAKHVTEFIVYAKDNPEIEFRVVDIGCGLAGLTAEDIAPLFKDAPSNCVFLGRLKHLLKR